MKWNVAHFVCFVFAVGGCGDRRVPVGWWQLGGSSGMNPPPAGMGGQSAGGAPMGVGGAGGLIAPIDASPDGALVRACAMPVAMPVRPLVTPGSEMGRRLARLLWLSEPDGPLQMASTALHTTADVAALARDMLQDPRSAGGLAALTKSWLRTGDVLTVPARAGAGSAATPELRASMASETERFVRDLVVTGGNLTRLFTASDSFVDKALGDLYGVAGPANGFADVMLNPSQRSGVLTHAGNLFAHPFATHRGAWIRETLLCQPLPPPPLGVDLTVVVPAGQTYRQTLNMKIVNQPACMPCHLLTDPNGFTLEHYDVLGRFRTTDNGLPVDSSSVIREFDNAMVDGARGLGEQLAASCDVKTCIARTFLAQTLGQTVGGVEEMAVDEVVRAFAAANFSLRDLLLATVQSPAFIHP